MFVLLFSSATEQADSADDDEPATTSKEWRVFDVEFVCYILIDGKVGAARHCTFGCFH